MNRLPLPLKDDSYILLKRGIYDDSTVDVYTNSSSDFAFLSPLPTIDYSQYKPRHQALGLSSYKKHLSIIESRFSKIKNIFSKANSVLEVGAADGSFLRHLKQYYPEIIVYAIEPDETTQAARNTIDDLHQFENLYEAEAAGLKFDIVCLFHVFEHLIDPASWLATAKRILAPGGQIIIEVPSLNDPLLSIYKSSAYLDFYFQKQHPFVYTGASLRRVLEYNGFIVQIMPYQRYGLDNHLTWLADGKAGGNADLETIFSGCAGGYRSALENRGLTDTVFAVARVLA